MSQIVQHLPRPLLSVLDRWSQAVARRRWQQRQRRWLQRKAALAASQATYHLKPWRD